MKKRIWIAVAAALMAAGLILFLLVRGNSSQTIGICYRENESSSNAAFRKDLEQALTQQGWELVVTDADGDQNKQLTLITRLAEKKCDILLLEPVMAEATEELQNRGVRTITKENLQDLLILTEQNPNFING